ncbi:hypothetical protein K1719_031293 [Acacia pycnantha]|nr:hypothetical protein K1719_031293 [Acacia pycnantha]
MFEKRERIEFFSSPQQGFILLYTLRVSRRGKQEVSIYCRYGMNMKRLEIKGIYMTQRSNTSIVDRTCPSCGHHIQRPPAWKRRWGLIFKSFTLSSMTSFPPLSCQTHEQDQRKREIGEATCVYS